MSGQLPSGHQHTIALGDQRAVVVEVGAGLRSYAVAGREVLSGYSEQEMATSAHGHPLIPWPNRLRDGQYTWDGTQHELPLTEPGKHNAIHGLVRWRNWTLTRQTTAEGRPTATSRGSGPTTATGTSAIHRRQPPGHLTAPAGSLGVEPMSAPPNALADQIDVIRLEPGEQTTATWGLQFQARAADQRRRAW
jgi:galactose mutarotase-like enzyme